MAEWEVVFKKGVGVGRDHPKDEELTLMIRHPDTYQMHTVRAILRSSFQDYPDADKLYYTSAIGGREEDPVPMEILEFLKEEREEVRRLPHAKPTLGQRKGRMLMDMIKERQEEKKK